MNYDELKPGPELDKLVAEKVMGWSKLNPPGDYIWSASTKIGDAWQVVRKVTDNKFTFHLSGTGNWAVRFCKDEMTLHRTLRVYNAYGNTPEVAICIAALKATENEN